MNLRRWVWMVVLVTVAVAQAETVQFGGKKDETGGDHFDRKINWNGVYTMCGGDGAKPVESLNSTHNGSAALGGFLRDGDPNFGSGLTMTFVGASGRISGDDLQNLMINGVATRGWSNDFVTVKFNQPVRLLGVDLPETGRKVKHYWDVYLGEPTSKGERIMRIQGVDGCTFSPAPVIDAGTEITFHAGEGTVAWFRSIRVEVMPERRTLGLIICKRLEDDAQMVL